MKIFPFSLAVLVALSAATLACAEAPNPAASDDTIYAHLQKGQDRAAKRIVDDLNAYQQANDTRQADPDTQVVLAAIPARYILERKAWGEALELEVGNRTAPYASAITRFTRAMGANMAGQLDLAQEEIKALAELRDAAKSAGQPVAENQIEVLRLAASAWLARSQGKWVTSTNIMREAADKEDSNEKVKALTNRLYPMRELLGDMLEEAQRPADALKEYDLSLQQAPDRFNGYYGAARAARSAGAREKVREYLDKLMALAKEGDNERPAVREAKRFAGNKP
jgi:predicted Zn-dependent protease